MKGFRIWLLGAVLFVGVIPIAAWAYYEPPHFSEPPVDSDCSNCHIQNPHHGFSSYPAKLNNLCQSCHFDGGPATGVLTHSSRTTDDDYGNWDLDCWSCHNPHSQEQESWLSTTYGKYIRRDLNAEIKEIDPAEPGPYYPPLSIIRTVTSDIVEFKGPTEFVDGDGVANDDICQVCHQQTHYYNTGTELNTHADFGADSQPGGVCTTCHKHENGFKASGHIDPDAVIVDSANCTGTVGCHDGTITGTWTPVPDIHKDVCSTCHVSSTGGGPLWEPWETEAPNGGDCEDCHNDHIAADTIAAKASIHHNFKYTDKVSQGGPAGSDGSAVKGLCVTCHLPEVDPNDGPVDPSTLWISQVPANTGLACNWCHIYWPNGTWNTTTGYAPGGYTFDGTGKLEIWNLSFDPNITPNTPNPPTETLLTSHAISEVTGAAPISDFSACLSCHGANQFVGTGGTAPQVFPYHGLGTPYAAEIDYAGGAPDCDDNNNKTAPCGGDDDDILNQYGTPFDIGSFQLAKTGSVHPGFRYIHDINTLVGMGSKGYGNSDTGSWGGVQPHIHDGDVPANGDEQQHFSNQPAGRYSQTHNIPWDDFAAGDPACFNAPPVPSTCQVNVNIGGQGMNAGDPKPTDMPVVPLYLP